MKSSELRIGNLIGYITVNMDLGIEVTELYPCILNDIAEIERGNICGRYHYIPITEDWHIRFGATKGIFLDFIYHTKLNGITDSAIIFSGDYVYIRQFDKDKDNPSMDDNLVTVWNKDVMKRDMFVHEWQNLYFALTGKELELKISKYESK